MAGNPLFRRKQYFIKKGFQVNFSIRFLALIVIEAALIAGLFWYSSLNTLTTGYEGAKLRIESTSDYFFPSFFMSNLIVVLIVGVIGIIGLILISHKIAGPLYRFEKGVTEVSKGDLSYRFKTRKGDQLTELSESLNSLVSMMDSKVEAMNLDVDGIMKVLEYIKLSSTPDSGEKEKIERLSREIIQRVNNLKDTLGQFNTSQNIKKKSNLPD